MTKDEAFTHQKILTSDRLHIRPIRMTDAEDFFALKSDPEVTHPYGQDPYLSLAEAEAWVQQRILDYERSSSLLWAITLKDEDVAIGSCCFWHFDSDFRCAELGYELRRAYWRKGIMSEALPAVISYGFEELGLHRIEACPLAGNTPSSDLLLKLGFRYEGKLRQRALFHGRFEDQLYYGLLMEEWPMFRVAESL
jgi:ribosomal-protein-alanine N-acetyltransferase